MPSLQIRRGSQFGATYTVAKSEEVKNEGEKYVRGKSEEGHDMELVFQVSNVHKTLAAVRKISKAGNRVVFDDDEGDYIYNKHSGLSTKTHQTNWTYVMFLWILEPIVSTGMFDVLAEKESEQVFGTGA